MEELANIVKVAAYVVTICSVLISIGAWVATQRQLVAKVTKIDKDLNNGIKDKVHHAAANAEAANENSVKLNDSMIRMRGEFREDISGLHDKANKMGERIAKVETRLDGLPCTNGAQRCEENQ